MSLPDLEAWAIFARLAELGSFAATAEALELSPPTVSKAIARLEHRLGERLVQRTSRRVRLTEAGRVLATRAQRMLAEAEAAEAEAQAAAAAPRGRVRLTAPASFGTRILAPLLPDLLAAHPGLALELVLDNRRIDLVAEGIDIALRIADLADSRLVARRLCPVRRLVVASPAYWSRHGTPTHPRDLAGHRCLHYTNLAGGPVWRFLGPAGETVSVHVSGPLAADEGEALAPALAAGQGVALQPDYLCWEALRDGVLAAVLEDWPAPPLALHVVTPPGGPRPPRIAAVVDFLVRRLAGGRAPWHAAA
jgi:DNA-binding transcriptional LysR family regulator